MEAERSPAGRSPRDGTLGLALGTAAAVVWGGQFIVAKSAFAHVGPIQINAIRYVPIALILLAMLARAEGWRALRPDGRARTFWLLGLGVVGFNILNYVGLKYTRPQSAALITTMAPLFVVFVAWGRTRIRPTVQTAICVVAALVGVAMVISHGDPGSYFEGGMRWGDLLCIAGTLSFAAYTLAAAEVADISPLRFTALSSVTAAVLMIALAIVAAAVGYDPVPSAGAVWSAFPALVYIALPGSVLAMLAWNRSARLIGGQNTALLMNLAPITVFAIQTVRGYRPVALEYLGVAITIGAVVANNLLSRRADRRASATLVVRPRTEESRA